MEAVETSLSIVIAAIAIHVTITSMTAIAIITVFIPVSLWLGKKLAGKA